MQSATSALSLSKRELVVAVVNDGDASGTARRMAGSHWSVLAYARGPDVFFSYDSLGICGNRVAARRLAEKLAAPLGARVPPVVVDAAVDKQANSYDCGTYFYFARSSNNAGCF